MIVLGIETSCDETAAAVAREGPQILANAIHSQIARHGGYGGVVPEIAARAHVEILPMVVQTALLQAGLDWSAIDAVAATQGPGLPTSLAVGFQAAKALAVRLKKPFFGVHHLEAHLYSIALAPDAARSPALFPALVLLVSGGHTALALVEGPGRYRLLGQTVDDAAGEALDKGAKLMGLPYPGGPAIERAAQSGNPRAVQFPRGAVVNARRDVRVERPDCCFSFSGLKTALRYYLAEHPIEDEAGRADVAASYQAAVVDTLATQVVRALEFERPVSLGCVGGVARNSELRRTLSEVARRHGLPFFVPPMDYCTDNAAMVAALAVERLRQSDLPTSLDADIVPSWPLQVGREAC